MVQWVLHMARNKQMPEVPELSPEAVDALAAIATNFDVAAAAGVKKIERTTNHDLKAVEYHIKKEMDKHQELVPLKEWVHFACTSEDVNNCAYALMLSRARAEVLLPKMDAVIAHLRTLAEKHAAQPMLSLTHGQTATPTTFGKEMAIFAHRLQHHRDKLAAVNIVGKFNGAAGNFNAHVTAYPLIDWPSVSSDFVRSLGIGYQPYSTQIECHDFVAEICDSVARFNTVLLDSDRDMWFYTMRGVLKLKTVAGEVGSSTMPHKVNPIDFENSEGNIGLSNALLHHFAEKLPVSRMQRDLSDSTVQRGLGTAFAHALIAYEATLRALSRITVNTAAMDAELESAWEVLAEPAQTLLRKHQVAGAYELLKGATRGQVMNADSMRAFFATLEGKLPPDDMARLQALRPGTYVGAAEELARAEGTRRP
jgi:adenylosuccinate lyase